MLPVPYTCHRTFELCLLPTRIHARFFLQSWSSHTDGFDWCPRWRTDKLGTKPRLSWGLWPPAKPSHPPQGISKISLGFSHRDASQTHLKISNMEECGLSPILLSLLWEKSCYHWSKISYDIMTEETGHRLLNNNHPPHRFLPLSVVYSGFYHVTLAATMHGHSYDIKMPLRTWKIHV